MSLDDWRGTIPEKTAINVLRELGFRDPLKHGKAETVIELISKGVAEAYDLGKETGEINEQYKRKNRELSRDS